MDIIAFIFPGLARRLDLILANQRDIMTDQAQHAQELRDLTAQNEKARQEIIAQIKALQDALDNAGGTTPEVDEAMAALKASVQMDDDMNADAPPPPPPPEE